MAYNNPDENQPMRHERQRDLYFQNAPQSFAKAYHNNQLVHECVRDSEIENRTTEQMLFFTVEMLVKELDRRDSAEMLPIHGDHNPAFDILFPKQ